MYHTMLDYCTCLGFHSPQKAMSISVISPAGYFLNNSYYSVFGLGVKSAMSLQWVWAPDAHWPLIATWPQFAIASLYDV